MSPLKLLFVTSELAPFSSTGGLAYVAQSFPKHLRQQGVDVRIIVPRFGQRTEQYASQMRVVAAFPVWVGGRAQPCEISLLEHDGNLIYFVKNEHYFGRDELYNQHDDAERFLFFNAAILHFATLGVFVPDIFHCNDWFSCPLALLLKTKYAAHPVLGNSKTLLSIRNFSYQGVYSREACAAFELRWDDLRAAGLDFFGYINLLKLGIVYADMIVTSSPRYAAEIQTPGYDALTATLRQRQGVVVGILEGIDERLDNPATDTRLFRTYGPADVTAGKRANKAALQARLGLPVRADIPLLGWVNRLTAQKGVDLLRLAMGNGLMESPLQIVACADGEPIFRDFFAQLAADHPEKFVFRPYDDALAYNVYAASDMYLMPSIYEPGGIAQLISMRYGSVPIVRATGGLHDTVPAYHSASGVGCGVVFEFDNAWIMMDAIRRALALFQEKAHWGRMVANCIRRDSSWKRPIDDYLILFDQLAGFQAQPAVRCA